MLSDKQRRSSPKRLGALAKGVCLAIGLFWAFPASAQDSIETQLKAIAAQLKAQESRLATQEKLLKSQQDTLAKQNAVIESQRQELAKMHQTEMVTATSAPMPTPIPRPANASGQPAIVQQAA